MQTPLGTLRIPMSTPLTNGTKLTLETLSLQPAAQATIKDGETISSPALNSNQSTIEELVTLLKNPGC